MVRQRRFTGWLVALLALRAASRADAGAARTSSGGGGGGGGSDPGITDKEIKLGGSYPFSGPASAYRAIADGAKAQFEFVNSQGGVDGRKINFQTLDDAYEPPKAVANARRLIEQEQVFALFNTLGTPNNLAIWDYVNEQKVPQAFVATGASNWGADVATHPYTTGWQPNYVTEAKIYADYLKKNKENAKVAVLYQNDGFGKDLLGGFEKRHRGLRRAGRRQGVLRGDRPDDHLADPQAGGLRRGHVPEHHDAEVLRAGDRDDREERLEAAAHPQQRRRLQDAGAQARRARERQGDRLDDLLQGPRLAGLGRRRRDEGVQGQRQEVRAACEPERLVHARTDGPRRRRWSRRSRT